MGKGLSGAYMDTSEILDEAFNGLSGGGGGGEGAIFSLPIPTGGLIGLSDPPEALSEAY